MGIVKTSEGIRLDNNCLCVNYGSRVRGFGIDNMHLCCS